MITTARIGIVLPLLCLGLAGCNDGHSLAVPSAPSTISPPSPQPPALQPTVTSITPNTGSTRGGAWGTITGTQFQSGATVTLGSGGVALAGVRNDVGTIWFITSASAAGRVDVTVTNPGGLSSTLAGAYTFAPPETFDFNGDWEACVGDGCEWNGLQFTIRDNMLVRVSCDGVVLTPPSGSPVRNGEFSFLGDNGAAISGRIVSPVQAVGTINVGRCVHPLTWPWSARRDDKSGAK
jgi:hypothetical protein